jgi:hypothetical protein
LRCNPASKIGNSPAAESHRLLVEMPAMKIRITLIAAISFCPSIVRADEAIFAWTYTTDLLPKGRWEFEQ